MESGSEYITVCDGVHIYDQEIGFASKKLKNYHLISDPRRTK